VGYANLLPNAFCFWYEDINGDFGGGETEPLMPGSMKKICSFSKTEMCKKHFINTKKKLQKNVHFYFETFRNENNPNCLKIKMCSFFKAFLVLMKLLSLSQFDAPNARKIFIVFVTLNGMNTEQDIKSCYTHFL